MVLIKGADEPVSARRLVAVAGQRARIGRRESPLVGREWELAALTAMLDRSSTGHGCVAGVVGPPGIGKSRIVAETSSIAASIGVQVFSTFCESHTSEVPFHRATRLLRAALGIAELDNEAARARVRAEVPGADRTDLVLLDDLLGIRDPAAELPDIAPDARRRRLSALVNAAALARSTPHVYVIEDAHWIDQTSESMLADLLSVVPQTHSLVLITYRPEYRGALSRAPGGQTIALAPLDDSQTGTLIADLLGSHPAVSRLADEAERAAGNPFFAEGIVRDLADRGVHRRTRRIRRPRRRHRGERAGHPAGRDRRAHRPTGGLCQTASQRRRGDRVAVRCGSADQPGRQLRHHGAHQAELVDQVMFTPRAEYAFRHPLIRTVAYRSQLKSDRARLHRRLAAAIEQQDPGSADENAALIAEHLEAAGDLHEAFGWHTRAGTWLIYRDVRAARMSWQRARQVADRLPAEDPERPAMRIAPRALVCVSTWRAGGASPTPA
jgi:adenylate cyclase